MVARAILKVCSRPGVVRVSAFRLSILRHISATMVDMDLDGQDAGEVGDEVGVHGSGPWRPLLDEETRKPKPQLPTKPHARARNQLIYTKLGKNPAFAPVDALAAAQERGRRVDRGST